jgi:hypothetical protein
MPHETSISRDRQASLLARDDHRPNAAATTDLSPNGARLSALAELARTGPVAVLQRQALQRLFGDGSSGVAPVQAKPISNKQMDDLGFVKMTPPRWQWNAKGGCHVSAIRIGAAVDEFHVRKDTKGAVNNRIDYNETAPDTWSETVANVPAGDELAAEMRVLGTQTAALIVNL